MPNSVAAWMQFMFGGNTGVNCIQPMAFGVAHPLAWPLLFLTDNIRKIWNFARQTLPSKSGGPTSVRTHLTNPFCQAAKQRSSVEKEKEKEEINCEMVKRRQFGSSVVV